MKKLIRFVFYIYHLLLASQMATCRFRPTCSKYALDAISKYGIFKGSVFATRRILSCHPFSKRPIYDPI